MHYLLYYTREQKFIAFLHQYIYVQYINAKYKLYSQVCIHIHIHTGVGCRAELLQKGAVDILNSLLQYCDEKGILILLKVYYACMYVCMYV